MVNETRAGGVNASERSPSQTSDGMPGDDRLETADSGDPAGGASDAEGASLRRDVRARQGATDSAEQSTQSTLVESGGAGWQVPALIALMSLIAFAILGGASYRAWRRRYPGP
jgi:hypothetical protein